MRLKIVSAIFALSIIFGINSPAFAENGQVISYQSWAKVLKAHVDEQGLVNYEKLKADRADLDQFIEQVESADLDGMSRNEKKAFWINAYNALTMRLIVDKYPLKLGGIRTINWGRPWSIKMKVAGQEISLGEIEHEILRKWDPIDPRIHFAINCASIGCPKLPDKVFDPKRLDQQLHFETKRFINDPQKVRLDREKNILYYSAILDWFEEDFLAVSNDVLGYIMKYINDDDRVYLEGNDVILQSLKYDWSLNKQ